MERIPKDHQRTYLVREVWIWQYWWQKTQNFWDVFFHRLDKCLIKIAAAFRRFPTQELRAEDDKKISKDLAIKFKIDDVNIPETYEIYVIEKGKRFALSSSALYQQCQLQFL